MSVINSTGLVDLMAASKSMKDAIGPFEIRVFGLTGGTSVPATADAAEVGQLLARLTRTGTTTKVARAVTVTPTAGTANTASWDVTINGVKISFTDDASPTATEICTGLYAAIRAAVGTTGVTTPACALNIPGLYGAVTVVNNTTYLTITAAVAGTPFTCVTGVSGAGAGTGTLITVETVADAYGLQFEDYADVLAGVMELKAGMIPNGLGLVAGTNSAVYARLVGINDDGTLSTSQPRMQGLCGVTGADFNLSHTDITLGDPITCSMGQASVPES